MFTAAVGPRTFAGYGLLSTTPRRPRQTAPVHLPGLRQGLLRATVSATPPDRQTWPGIHTQSPQCRATAAPVGPKASFRRSPMNTWQQNPVLTKTNICCFVVVDVYSYNNRLLLIIIVINSRAIVLTTKRIIRWTAIRNVHILICSLPS